MPHSSPNPASIPDFVTHYARSEPFRCITSAPPEQWPELIRELNESNAWGLGRFADPHYLAHRVELERRLRDEFIVKGGRPELKHPIYCFLGRNPRFEEHPLNQGYLIHLKNIPSAKISFTYGDSLLAYQKDYREQAGEPYCNPLCARLYRVEELEALVSDPRYPKREALAIEAHLWMAPPKKIVRRIPRGD